MRFRVLAVDDEQIALEAISFTVNKYMRDQVHLETASTGREAIETCQYFHPDIVLMDINMPGINGIEAIREIKSGSMHTHFVIISAYEHFEYAQEALQLGVMEYILKPLTQKRLMEALDKVIASIEAQRKARKLEIDLKDKLGNVLQVLEHGFIHAVMLFDGNLEELERYRKLLDLKTRGGLMLTLELGSQEVKMSSSRISLSVQGQKKYSTALESIKALTPAIVGPVILNRIMVFLPCELPSDESLHRTEIKALAQNLQKRLSEKLQTPISIGIGNYAELESITSSYEESIKALAGLNSGDICHIGEMRVQGPTLAPEASLTTKLLDSLAIGDPQSTQAAFLSLSDSFILNNEKLLQKNRYIGVMSVIYQHSINLGVLPADLPGYDNYIDILYNMTDVASPRAWCKDRLDKLSREIVSARKRRLSDVVRKAASYLELHYSTEIQLEAIASIVNVTPNYLCRIFKEETGQIMTDYLTNIRVGKAKKWLEKGEMPIKEIASLAGYADSNYFSRVFKKITGFSPSEYRELRSIHGGND